jgi:hypothetical protein
MANFCNTCGAPVTGVFCNKCGADLRQTPAQPRPLPASPAPASPPPAAQWQPVVTVAAPPNPAPVAPPQPPSFQPVQFQAVPLQPSPVQTVAVQPLPVQAPPAPMAAAQPTKGSPWVKILVAFVLVVIFFGAVAVGGVYYVVYRVKKKVHEVAASLPFDTNTITKPGSSPAGNNSAASHGATGSIPNPCSLLDKSEVGNAIGVPIVETTTDEGGCSYLAEGTSADMTSKHLAAMMKSNGADSQQQKMIQNFAGGMFKAMQEEHPKDAPDTNGKVPVFNFSVDTNSAETQMQLNEKVMGSFGSGSKLIPGIGDEAFEVGNSMLMVRKGNKLIRIMFMMCPCNSDSIKPLAKTLADRL